MIARGSRASRILILAGILLALALPLMFLLEDFMRDAVVTPLAYLAWLVGTIVGALPEGCLLIPFVAVAVLLAIRSLQRGREEVPSSRPVYRTSVGAAHLWLERIEHVAAGTYAPERLEHYVGQLLMDIMGHENRLSPRDTMRKIEDGEIAVPGDVRRFVDAAFQSGVVPKQGWLARLGTSVIQALRGRRRTGVSGDEIAERVDPALVFIEEELRMRHLESGGE